MLKWIKKLLRKKHKLADFSQLEPNQQVPTPSGRSVDGLGLTNPDSVLSGTNRGTQFVGSASLQVDSTQNLITVKGSNAVNANNVLRFGQVSSNFLGMAVNTGTVDSMFAGQDSSGNTVVKIAKTGVDVKTATNDQLIFNSGQNMFKIVSVQTISVSFTLAGAAATFGLNSIAHNLGYTPGYNAYITLDPVFAAGTDTGVANVHNPYTQFAIAGGTTLQPQLWAGVTVDSTKIYFEVITRIFGASTVTCSAKVYLLQETQTGTS